MAMAKKRVCAFLMCFTILFQLVLVTQKPVKAEVASATVITAVGAYMLVSAGILFATTGDLQTAVTGFLDSSADVKNWCTTVAGTYADGVCTISSAVAAGIPIVFQQIQSYFSAQQGTVSVLDPTVTNYIDKYGAIANIMVGLQYPAWLTSAAPFAYTVSDTVTVLAPSGYTRSYGLRMVGEGDARRCETGYYYKETESGVVDWTTMAYTNIGNSTDVITWGLFSFIENGVTYVAPTMRNSDGSFLTTNYNDVGKCVPLSVFATQAGSIDVDYGSDTAYDRDRVASGYGTAIAVGSICADITTTGVLSDVSTADKTATVSATQTGVITSSGVLNPAIPAIPVVPPVAVPTGFEGFVLPDLTNVFPFCIPFDFIRLVKVFDVNPIAPRWEIPLNFDFVGVNYIFVLDLTQFEVLAVVLRWGLFLFFIFGLIVLTRNMIRG